METPGEPSREPPGAPPGAPPTLLLWPTARPQAFVAVCTRWLVTAAGAVAVWAAVDDAAAAALLEPWRAADPARRRVLVCDPPQRGACFPLFCLSARAAADPALGDALVVCASDDMLPMVAGWDARLRRCAEECAEQAGAERAGAERAGAERAGAERAGAERTGAEQAGAERAGAERAGAERAGAEQSGAERAGAEQSGDPPPAALPPLLLVLDDGCQRGAHAVATLPVLSAAGLRALGGAVYNPVFPHMWADVELYEVAAALGMLVDVRPEAPGGGRTGAPAGARRAPPRPPLFRHFHWAYGGRPADAVDRALDALPAHAGLLEARRALPPAARLAVPAGLRARAAAARWVGE